ncbi:MAG TPA: hypothetical protein VHA37_09450 [Candidatus Saccharimonadales bacterium]|nr:hypothetical protein [Candidatus Saccharimonadales bacterium]
MTQQRHPDHVIEALIDGNEQVVAIEPPVDTVFREKMFDVLTASGLIKEVVAHNTFFETRHLANGAPYSELRLSSTALRVAGTTIVRLAHESAEVLQELDRTATVSPYLLSSSGTRSLFEDH